MSLTKNVLASCCLVLTAPLSSLATEPAQERTFTFRFDPCAQQTEFLQRVKTTRIKDLGSLGSQVDESTTETRVQVNRTTTGFKVTGTPVSAQLTRDGQPVGNPLAAALQRVEVSYELDKEGRLLEVVGIAEALTELTSSLPEGAAAAFSKLVTAESLEARERAEWNGRIGDFVGATVAVGDTWEGEAPFQLPSGEEIQFWNHTSFERARDCEPCLCLEIVTTYTSDVSAFAALASKTVAEVVAATGGAADQADVSASVTGSARRIIDPRTMRIYSERSERTMTFVVHQTDGGPTPVVMTETRDYEFEYFEPYCGGS